MPIQLAHTQGTVLIRRSAFERVNLTRSAVDERYNLTDEEDLEKAMINVEKYHQEEQQQPCQVEPEVECLPARARHAMNGIRFASD